MKKKIVKADLDEMVFENRDKTYGAYPLRKSYPWHLITSLALVMHVFLVGVTYPIWSTELNERGIYLENFTPLLSPFPYLGSHKHEPSQKNTKERPIAVGVCVLVEPETSFQNLKNLPATETYSSLNFFRAKKQQCANPQSKR